MDVTSRIQIRSTARSLLASHWKKQGAFSPGKTGDIHDFLLLAPNRIAVDMLGLSVVETKEIRNLEILNGRNPLVEFAGILDRKLKRIVVAGKFGFEHSRFTLAHEIGHYLLHPGLLLHREEPLAFSSRVKRSRQEGEADLFGAELLMPSKLVQKDFLFRFKGIVDGSRRNPAIHYWLSSHDPNLDADRFFANDPRFRAEQLAQTRYSFGRPITSMCEIFRVSPAAMAIQLIDLGLVK